MDTFDVVVVGAGMAGVVAARDLSRTGRSVILLEARDRVGGRTWTKSVYGERLEMGGAYVHWTQPHIWNELERHNLARLVPPRASSKVYWLADGSVRSGTREEYTNVVHPLLARLFADARTWFPCPFDLGAVDTSLIEDETIHDRIDSLNLSRFERDCLEGALSGVVRSYKDHGIAQMLHAVAGFFGRYEAFYETAGGWSVEGGTGALINAILSEAACEVRLSSPVSSIIDRGNEVVISVDHGHQVKARAVVVATPLNTLGDIDITPPLPRDVQNMIEEKNPVMASKIWVRAKGEVEDFVAYCPAGQHPFNVAKTTTRLQDGDTLIMVLGGDTALIDGHSREQVQGALRTFVPSIEVIETHCCEWASEQYSKGGWMMHRPGHLTNAAPRIRKPHGRIVFAGSDIAEMYPGSIEGAAQSGAAAARLVEVAADTFTCEREIKL